MKAVLALEDGTAFYGESFGVAREFIGKVVFNTSMTGYQEILTDPTINGEIVAMTYPLIGNYGFNEEDIESNCMFARGFVVKELCEVPSNWRCRFTAEEYCKNNNIVGIRGIDTRSLTQHIRSNGSMLGIISTETDNTDLLLEKISKYTEKKHNLVADVSTKSVKHIEGFGKRVAVIDYGIKYSLLRCLRAMDCDLYIMPYDSTFEDIMSVKPEGILLSNGPGDPNDLTGQVLTVKKLIGVLPVQGIGLGHQILGLALGGKVCKLKYGHHGANHPVKNIITGKCQITLQNHNYALESDFSRDIAITHVNLNDNTVEGFRHKLLPLFGLQFHPASLSSQDLEDMFGEFMNQVNKCSS